ncbi:MAG TPA: hypothetical protein VGH43_03155 [Jatrophihabitans sp.]
MRVSLSSRRAVVVEGDGRARDDQPDGPDDALVAGDRHAGAHERDGEHRQQTEHAEPGGYQLVAQTDPRERAGRDDDAEPADERAEIVDHVVDELGLVAELFTVQAAGQVDRHSQLPPVAEYERRRRGDDAAAPHVCALL